MVGGDDGGYVRFRAPHLDSGLRRKDGRGGSGMTGVTNPCGMDHMRDSTSPFHLDSGLRRKDGLGVAALGVDDGRVVGFRRLAERRGATPANGRRDV